MHLLTRHHPVESKHTSFVLRNVHKVRKVLMWSNDILSGQMCTNVRNYSKIALIYKLLYMDTGELKLIQRKTTKNIEFALLLHDPREP